MKLDWGADQVRTAYYGDDGASLGTKVHTTEQGSRRGAKGGAENKKAGPLVL